MRRVGIVCDSGFLDHRTPDGHPEHHSRLAAVYDRLDAEPDLGAHLDPILPRPASEQDIVRIHRPGYYRQIAATAASAHSALTADTHTSDGSFRAACLAAGGMFAGIEAVVEGRVAGALALVRPPGHHAEASRALGYCLFNNAALGAAFARERFGLQRILIVDWDVHHGNGTQHAFEADPGVLFFSTHQFPLFPGTGHFTETGRGAGEGFTVNLPLPRGYGDGEYAAIFQRILRPLAESFAPQLILVSAGFDTHQDDPLGGMRMTAGGFAALTRILMEAASDICQGRLVLVLEGGYHRQALADSVVAVLAEMADLTRTVGDETAAAAAPRKLDYVFSRCLPVLGRFWPCLY